MWLDCPRRYRMHYVDRPKPPPGPPWAHNSLGNSVHGALARWWDLPRPRRTPAAAGDLLEAGWLTDGFRDDDHAAAWRARARAMVVSYAEGLDPDAEPLGVERTMAARSGVMALSGRIDRVDERGGVAGGEGDGGEAVVVDYKTGRHPLTTDDVRSSLALAIYAVVTEATLRRRCRRVELHHLPSGEVHAWEHTDESLARHLRRAGDIAEEAFGAEAALQARPDDPALADGLFPVRPGPACSWCDLRAHCPAGANVVPRRPWDGLPD